MPKFSLTAADTKERTILSISNGTVAYTPDRPILTEINLSLGAQDRLAIVGDNGSGKSTLIKAILGDSTVIKTGDWYVPLKDQIWYLDQHYSTLAPNRSVFETIACLVPHWSHVDIRRHLNDFLFRKNEEINLAVAQLSGGEKARLSLAQIAAHTPKLLILDEVTNNLDLENKAHVINVLKQYPGAMIVIAHEPDFLQAINVEQLYFVKLFR